MRDRYCITCGKSLDKQTIKPSWELAWGLMWRCSLLAIIVYAVIIMAVVFTVRYI
jgi:hypothetical protein